MQLLPTPKPNFYSTTNSTTNNSTNNLYSTTTTTKKTRRQTEAFCYTFSFITELKTQGDLNKNDLPLDIFFKCDPPPSS